MNVDNLASTLHYSTKYCCSTRKV